MSEISLQGSAAGDAGRRGSALKVSDTYWGYEIRNREDRREGERLAEPVLKFLGLVSVLAAYGQWFLPAHLYSGNATVMKATLCFLLGAAGVWLYWYASRGLLTSVEMDLSRREIRVVRQNHRGRRRLEAAVPMARVESAFVERTKAPGHLAHLCLRMRAPEAVLHVAAGPVRELETLHRRLSHDLKPMSERIDDRLGRSVAFRTRRA